MYCEHLFHLLRKTARWNTEGAVIDPIGHVGQAAIDNVDRIEGGVKLIAEKVGIGRRNLRVLGSIDRKQNRLDHVALLVEYQQFEQGRPGEIDRLGRHDTDCDRSREVHQLTAETLHRKVHKSWR